MGICLSKLCCCRRVQTKSKENVSLDSLSHGRDNRAFQKEVEDDHFNNGQQGFQQQHQHGNTGRPSFPSTRNQQQTRNAENTPPEYENTCIVIALYNFKARTSQELSFNKGDELQIFGELDENWWDAELLNPPYGKGLVPYNYVAKKGSIEAQPYFYGKLSRNEAQDSLLSSADSSSSFLVRVSGTKSDSYALSLRDGADVKHYLIRTDGEDYFIHESVKKKTVPLLIEYHRKGDCGSIKTLGQPHVKSSDEWEIDRSLLRLGKELGSGNFGSVYEATLNGETRVAVKTLKQGCLDSENFLKEADIMKRLIHPRVVQLYGVCTDEDPFYIVTELMPHGDLLTYLRKGNGKKLKVSQLVEIGEQIASGMAYLEFEKFIHRDLAARNILVGEYNLCKIADFGFARLTLQDDTYVSSTPGVKIPVRWTAPEAMRYQEYSVKSDVWSFGILLTEIIEKGMKPYPDIATNSEILPQLLRGYRMPKSIMQNCPDKLYNLMYKCWNMEPHLRPSFAEILNELEHFYGPNKADPYE